LRIVDIHTSPTGWKVIGCAIEVHRTLGPGLVESAYERGVAREFRIQGLRFKQQVTLPGAYKGEDLGKVYRVDFVVEDELVIEVKAASQTVFVHRAQLRTYLRMLGLRQGLLLNFNMPRLVDGLTSVLLPERPAGSEGSQGSGDV
jgi:GxxExxY protein